MGRGCSRGRSGDLARRSCGQRAKALGAAYNEGRRVDAGHAARSHRSSGRRRGVEPWQNPAMWRLDPSGPQGPMQVGAAATTDVGGGDRFDLSQNRAIGRAYLARLYGRYKNWPDAVAAYNWGLSNVDTWIRAGRPPQKLLAGVAAYTTRVLYDSGLCFAGQTTQLPEFAILHSDPGPSLAGANPLSPSILAHFGADAGAFTRNQQYLCGSVPSSFSRAGRLRARECTTPQSRLAEMTGPAQRAWRLATRGSQM